MDKNILLQQRISRMYLRFLIPTVIGMVTQSVYCLADVYFISAGTGANGLAALNIAMPIFTIMSAIGLWVGVGCATTMSVSEGAGCIEDKHKVFTMAMILAAGAGIVLTLGECLFLEPFSRMLGATDALLPDVLTYLRPIILLSTFNIIGWVLQIVIRADNAPGLVMGATVVSSLLNIVLDYLFVIVWRWGLFGASFATALSSCVSCALLCSYYFHRERNIRFVKNCWNGKLFRRMIGNGAASAMLETSAGIVIILFNYAILNIAAPIYLAAYSVITNIAYVGKGILNGFAQAVQPIISTNHGAKLFHRVHHSLGIACLYTVSVALIGYGIILLFPGQIAGIFAKGDQTLLKLAEHGILLYFSSFVLTAANTIFMYYLQSIEKGRLSTLFTIIRGFLLILVGLMILPSWLGIDGVWLCVTFAEGITLLISLPFIYKQIRQDKKRLLEEEDYEKSICVPDLGIE